MSEYYALCIKKAKEEGAMYPDLDALCLQCGMRIASHTLEEYDRCEEEYQNTP